MRLQLVLQLDVVLPTAVVLVNLGAALIGRLSHLWQLDRQGDPLGILCHLVPSYTVIRLFRQGLGCLRDEVPSLAVHPHQRQQL